MLSELAPSMYYYAEAGLTNRLSWQPTGKLHLAKIQLQVFEGAHLGAILISGHLSEGESFSKPQALSWLRPVGLVYIRLIATIANVSRQCIFSPALT